MNIFLIVAQTADGFIAKQSNHSPFEWTSKEDKRHFVNLTKTARAIVMGSSTFRTLPSPLKERLNVVYSKDPELKELYKDSNDVLVTDASPKDLVDELSRRGYNDLAVCGGSQIYTLFMKSGLVDKIYLTIEPVMFGKGMNIFNEPLDVKMKLISKEITEGGTIFLEYKVEK